MVGRKMMDMTIKAVSAGSRLRFVLALVLMSSVAFMGFVSPALADGSVQISGMGEFAGPGECEEDVAGPAGQAPDFALKLTGDLGGCLYTFVETFRCDPSGAYHETGTELYVADGSAGDEGTFRTTYRFTAKYDDCPNFGGQQHGRCQHPIAMGSGTGDYEGVEGRLDFKDNVDVGNFSYRGHVRWP